MKNRLVFFPALFTALSLLGFSQRDSNLVCRLDFNGHSFEDATGKIAIRTIGVVLTDDRFGNKESAGYVLGHPSSYINLGTSDILKSKEITISMWVNIQTRVYHGKGYTHNPFIIIKNGPGDDFVHAYFLGYNFKSGRFGMEACRDSLTMVITYSKDTVNYGTWYHLAFTSDSSYFTFYINGKMESHMGKGFASVFYKGDSIVMGRSVGDKNQRYTHAIFDDICIYNKVLKPEEIRQLYDEPNPNRFKNILSEIFKYGVFVFILSIVVITFLLRNKRHLKRQKEYYELNNRIRELEAQAIRAQMNPHFISNSMAAIQNLIYNKEYTKASQYLAKATFLMRQVLDLYDKLYISLEEELGFIKLNVELEQLRFDANFSFEIHIEDGIDPKQVIIPALITQPLVENAIWHGLLPLTKRKPRLTIRVYAENKLTFVAIEDNGVGRTKHEGEAERSRKGIQLVLDKIASINQLRNSADFKMTILDAFSEDSSRAGTKIIIQLVNYNQE